MNPEQRRILTSIGVTLRDFPESIELAYTAPKLTMTLTQYAAGFSNPINMQDTRACFEAWCLIIKAKTSNPGLEIELDVKNITEAMACGVPAVSFACPCGPKDIIRDGEDGLLVENGKTEELAEKINYLIENEQIRKEMGKKARINVQRFAEDVIMQQWIQLFNNLLNGTKQ